MQHISNCKSKYTMEASSNFNFFFNIIWMQPLLNIPVVVPPPHHVLIVGGGRDLKPLDVFIGAKKEGIIPRCVV